MLAALAIAAISAPAPAVGAEVVLAADTDFVIKRRGDFGNAGEAVEALLRKYLLLALQKETLAGSGPTVRFALESRAGEWHELPRDAIRDITDIDAFEIEIAPKDTEQVQIRGATAVATAYGVLHFLEEHMGIMWLFPGELGLHVPDRETFRLAEAKQRVAPAFVSRIYTGLELRHPGAVPAHEGVLQRERHFFNAWDHLKSLKLHFLSYASHNMTNIVSLNLKDEHPEVFPIVDGERWFPPPKPEGQKLSGGRWQAWHPCYTHPTTIEIAIGKAREAFEKGRRHTFSLGIGLGQVRARGRGVTDGGHARVAQQLAAVRRGDGGGLRVLQAGDRGGERPCAR
jgi:hypothetical protein